MDGVNPDTGNLVSGQSPPMLAATSPAQVDAMIRATFTRARQRLYIRAVRLEFDVFRSEDLLSLITPLIKGNVRNRVHFLLDDTLHLLRGHPRIIHLARNFSSFVKVHTPLEGYTDDTRFFIVADGKSYLKQSSSERFPVHASLSAPARAAKLEYRFNELWQRSQCVDEIFRLGL